jgi:putative ABC transport system ATP-binding protein
MGIFQQLNTRGITVVIVTHEPDIAAYTNLNVTFRDGKILKKNVVPKPKNAIEELLALPVIKDEEEIL